MLLALISSFSVGYVFYNRDIGAASISTYTTAGNATGRVNIAPTNMTLRNGGLQKGDRLYLMDDIGFQLIVYDQNYNDYIGGSSGAVYGDPISAWYSLSDMLGRGAVVDNVSKFDQPLSSEWGGHGNLYQNSNIQPFLSDMNRIIAVDTVLQKIIAPQDLKPKRDYYNYKMSQSSSRVYHPSTYLAKEILDFYRGAKIYPLSLADGGYKLSMWDPSTGSFGLSGISESDFAYSELVHTMSSVYRGLDTWTLKYKLDGSVASDADIMSATAFRASAFIDTKEIVFAVSNGNDATYSEVSAPTLNSSQVYLSSGDNMKPRIYNSNMSAALSLIQNRNGDVISKTQKGSSVKLNVQANSYQGSIISLMVFKDQELQFYIPLESAKTGLIDCDLSMLDVGNYQLAVVNEIFDNSNTLPTESSYISDVISLQIVEPHKLTYTKTPQSGASAGNDYEFSKNVNAGQTVGKITVNPQGVMLLSYTVETNGDNTYQNFEIDGLSSGTSSSTSLNVKIKSGAPDLVNGGLKTGTYKFCVSAVDANGDPTTATSDSKVCTSFTVAKTNLSVAFNDPAMTKKSIANAATVWNETATATPSNGTKITYTKVGGDVGMINIDPNTAAITYNGGNAFGKVKIRASADDDPSTGLDNYNPAFVEKEIVIYREVDGVVTPDPASSDTTIPTFSASDANISTGGTIGKIQGTLGTPDTIGGSTTTFSYVIKPGGDGGMFQVNSSTGVIKSNANLGVGTYSFIIIVSDRWSNKEIPVTVNVGMAPAENLKFYENSTSSIVITTKSARATDTGVSVFATVRGSSNTNPVTYRIQDGSTNVITVHPSSGAITINGVGTVVIVAEKNGNSGQANAQALLTFTVTAGAQNFIYTDSGGNELPKTGGNYDAIDEVYAPSKTFQLYTAGNPTGSTVTYQLKSGSPTDVISVDGNGLVHVLNASISPSQIDKVIVEATSHDPTGNYSDKTIEIAINITKANQTISFAGITYATSGRGQVTPVINEQDISSNAGGVSVADTAYYITIDSSISTTIAWTSNGIDIDYNYSGATGITIPLHVEKAGNRNYNRAQATGSMKILGPNESTLAISRPGTIIYGDHFTIRSLQDDSSSVNVNYTFTVDNTTYISNPTVNGNMAEFDALKYSGSTSINIKVTRTADGEVPLSKTINVQVLPKPIEIIIDDKDKLKGEVNPTLTYQDFKNQLVSWNGVQDSIQENDIRLSTTANTNSNAGNYPIKGDSNLLNRTYPNYTFTFKEGTLKIKEENVEADWYHLEADDGSNTLYTGNWTNQDVNIISDHSEYIHMSLDQSTWKPNQVTVSKEGETNQSFWMKKDSGAITKEKQEIIRIDKTAPKVKGIKAKDTNNTLQDIINVLSGGIFFKPGTSFEITTSDKKDDLKVSGTKEIAYKVYKITDTGDDEIKAGTLTVTNEKAKITISETVGKYKVCVIPTDNAGNTNTESCHEVTLKKIDVDVDGDGKPDFNDPDGDGCPDLNIKWKDPNDENKWIVINGDRNYDGIPDLNIDSDGDGKPDLNIDTDNDGKPDLNLVILKKSDWKPTKCVKADSDNGILEEYCTGTSVKAVINVDTDNDGIPNINIDNKGDFKPHINISKDGETPSVNIVEIHEWKPKKDYKSGKFTYDSIGKNDIKPEINIDSDGDGLPDINVDIDGDGEPDINIDIDGDGIPDIDIDSDGDGIPDVNVDNDGDGKPDENIIKITEWKPGKNVDGDFPYDTMDFSEPVDPNGDGTSVKGQYNPANSMGGASTGDNTNIMIYMGISLLSLCLLSYIIYKYQIEIK